METIIQNLKKVLSSKTPVISTIIAIILIGSLFNYFSDRELIIGNMWYGYYIFELSLEIIITILFWLFIWSTVYKIKYFSKPNKKHLWIWWVASFFWIIVAGCPTCSITLASYLWLASILAVLPYYWLELKVISVFLLVYVVYDTLKTLEVCKIKK